MIKQTRLGTALVRKLVVEQINSISFSAIEIARKLSACGARAVWENSQLQTAVDGAQIHVPPRYSYLQIFANELSIDQADPFEALTEIAELNQAATIQKLLADSPVELPDFVGGAIGFLSYDALRYVEEIPGVKQRADQPTAYFLFDGITVACDREQQRILLLALPDVSREALVRERMELLKQQLLALEPSVPCPLSSREAEFSEQFSAAEFSAIVSRAKEYILAGDIFQVVLANSFTASKSVDPFALYASLATENRSAYHFLIEFGDQTLVGASPEVFLKADQFQVHMRLVAGTYPRSSDATEDLKLREQLKLDEKECAEHIMLVDHARNDIGRVAKIGSVYVEDLLHVETFRDVHHLISEVGGSLEPAASLIDAIRSCFPIATLIGTPKVRAMEITAELEGPSRGVFGGSMLMLGYNGYLDSTVIIRSAVCSKTSTLIQAGAGIVHDSIPEREYEECRWKARALFDAVERL